LDFGFSIEPQENKLMNAFPSKSLSDNRKSAIQNPKWLGLSVIVFVLVVCGAVVEAQQPGKIFRIGFLDSSTASGSAGLVEAFRQEMRKLGWIEGKNIAIEYRFAEQKPERLPELAADLVHLRVDLIVVTGTPPALTAKSATGALPIVMTNSGDPVGACAVPKLSRVGLLLGSRGGIADDLQLKDLRAAALVLKLKLEEIKTEFDAKGLESAFQTAKQKQVNAIMTIASRTFLGERKRIVELASKYRLPVIYFQKEFVDEGGLMSYGADYDDLYRRAAVYVDKILKGAKPADLPVQQATKFEFIINLKAAKQIDLTIPNKLLERANKVIK
jgi:putative tryptophan/tyrosine transport system substrate-binding protein